MNQGKAFVFITCYKLYSLNSSLILLSFKNSLFLLPPHLPPHTAKIGGKLPPAPLGSGLEWLAGSARRRPWFLMGRVAAGQDRGLFTEDGGAQECTGTRSSGRAAQGAQGTAERSSWQSLLGAPGLEEPRVSRVRGEGFWQSQAGAQDCNDRGWTGHWRWQGGVGEELAFL